MKNKVILFIGVLLSLGCGGGGTDKSGDDPSGTPSTNTPTTNTPNSNTVATGTGTYVDSPINGVRYECGLKTGITGDAGVAGGFIFEVGKSCIFTINSYGMTSIAAANLSEGVEVRPNEEVARYLQSLDKDGNPDNGIEIHADVVQALAAKGINGLQQTDIQVQNMVAALSDVGVYGGSYKSMDEAKEHLYRFSAQIETDKAKDDYRVGDRVTFTANVTGGEGATYLWKEGSTTLGTSQQLNVDNFNAGLHTITLTVTNVDGVTLNYSVIITVGEAYNHTVNITSSNSTPNSDQSVTLTAHVSGAEGTVTYLWKDGLDTIGTSSTVTKTFTAGVHTVTVEASANNLTKSDSITFNVTDPNSPPVADAGDDITATYGTIFTFDGSGSTDSDGTIVRYEWIYPASDNLVMSGSAAPTFDKNASTLGDHTVVLKVTDNQGATGQDTIIVHVVE